MRFSIVTVALNPGKKLQTTLDSVFRQTCTDYEVILKDGGSTDGSMDRWKDTPKDIAEVWGRVRFFEKPDRGIYDAMNQGVQEAKGEYVLFLNCGDVLADEKVLERAAEYIDSKEPPMVLYGDTFRAGTKVRIASPPRITGFTCYRNIPCHQSCFYSMELCRKKPYDLRYKIRADYDHFLWCFYRAGASFRYMEFPVSSYEGGGYSESRENGTQDRREHRAIVREYMSGPELFRYRAAMALTLAPLRRKMAESRLFAGSYHRLKKAVYGNRK
ncbi:MAG: glycosyltransferase [Firmicutes bacterium]|nr:glycosyltransferase [Bacillota bacterium]